MLLRSFLVDLKYSPVHYLFWQLHAQMHDMEQSARFQQCSQNVTENDTDNSRAFLFDDPQNCSVFVYHLDMLQSMDRCLQGFRHHFNFTKHRSKSLCFL